MKLRVKNLTVDTTAKDLLHLFKRFGRVRRIILGHELAPGHEHDVLLPGHLHQCFAMIMMGSNAEATAALKALNGRDFGGNYLVVEEVRTE